MQRNTLQKEIVYQQVMSMHDHPNADEIYEAIHGEHPQISRATVYRVLNQLADNGVINRLHIPNEADIYDFNNKDHYHIVCSKCHRVYDLDIKDEQIKIDVDEVFNGFRVIGKTLVFNGVCPHCIIKEREN